MPPPFAVAANCEPSAEEATCVQVRPGALLCVQVSPPSVEVQMPLPEYAASRKPSADETMDAHCSPGALVCVQVSPLFVEVQMLPKLYSPAASRVPSAEEA